jgi:hypothetical protein
MLGFAAVSMLALSGCASTSSAEPASSPAATASAAPSFSSGAPSSVPELDGITYETPAGWTEHKEGKLSFALPPEYVVEEDWTTDDDVHAVMYESPTMATPSLHMTVQTQSWTDVTGVEFDATTLGAEWRAVPVAGPGLKIVAVTDKVHVADGGAEEPYKVINFQVFRVNSDSYQLQVWLPIDADPEPMVRDIAGTLSIG